MNVCFSSAFLRLFLFVMAKQYEQQAVEVMASVHLLVVHFPSMVVMEICQLNHLENELAIEHAFFSLL